MLRHCRVGGKWWDHNKSMTTTHTRQDAGLSYDIELRTEMFSSMVRVIQEINLRFQQLHKLTAKYIFRTPICLIDTQYKCQAASLLGQIVMTLIKMSS